jgi:hypothetical protein|tara:strand:- start:331 stop:756 length:426 start_codon:yes stop_codon:yes gene_type:complete
MKVNLRMNLSHFINKPFEKDVINKLNEVHKDSIKFYLILWYEEGSLKPKDLKDFMLKYESNLHFKTTMRVGDSLKPNEFIWFDLSNNFNLGGNQVRFQYNYIKEESILEGLNEFHKCAKFCTSEKPKKQKRNDYESSDSRK